MEKIGKYITKYVKGKTPKELYEAPAEGLLPYLSPDYLRDKAAPEFYASPSSKTVQVGDGDVIVLWDGSNAGEIFISKKGILASTMVKLDFDEAEIYKPYYSYSFQYLEYVLKAKTAGSGIPHADKGVIKRLEFFKPEIPEQKAIATILSKVDEAIKATETSIRAAEKLKKSLMQNLLTGKLKPDGTWRKEDDFYKDEKFGNVPVGWEVKKLKKIFKLKNGKGNPTENLRSEPIAEFQIPVYGGNGITGYFDKPFLTSSTLIIGRVGEYCGSLYKTPNQCWVTDNALWVSEVFIESFDLDFWYSLLTFKKLNQYGDATGQPKITQSGIGNLKVAYPPNIEEQNSISSKIIQIDNLILEKKSKLKSTIKLKKSLMQNLLTGKVRVDLSKIENVITNETI